MSWQVRRSTTTLPDRDRAVKMKVATNALGCMYVCMYVCTYVRVYLVYILVLTLGSSKRCSYPVHRRATVGEAREGGCRVGAAEVSSTWQGDPTNNSAYETVASPRLGSSCVRWMQQTPVRPSASSHATLAPWTRASHARNCE
jgi:hypothetical protein